jgi:hypothetical protein
MVMRSPKPVASRTTVVVILTAALGMPAGAQPCNPAIDGTYCATQPSYGQNSLQAASPSVGFDGLGASLSPYDADDSGTLGAITFNSDGKRCLGGLLRGVRCN